MLYYLFDYLEKFYDFPGAGMFQYISFRAALAIITSLTISLLFGKSLINYLRNNRPPSNPLDGRTPPPGIGR